MKLLLCEACWDVRKLFIGEKVSCQCGQAWGQYTDGLNAVYGGRAVMLGFANTSLIQAIDDNKTKGALVVRGQEKGRGFSAFVIPESAPTVKRE